MSKRFTDNGLWEKEWFQDLPAAEKLAWFFIKDRCDAAGVWSPSRRTAEFFIGEAIDWEGFAGRCNGNILVMPNGKWWLVDFCDFQYGELTASCRPHRAVLSLLEKHGLLERVLKGYRKGNDTLKDKEEEKEGKKEKDRTAEPKAPRPDPAADLYEHYKTTIRSGARIDAIASIRKRLGEHTAEQLTAAVDNYARVVSRNGTEERFRIQANNFFGKEARFEEYLHGAPEPAKVRPVERPMGTDL